MLPSGSPPDWSGLTDAGDGTAGPRARAGTPGARSRGADHRDPAAGRRSRKAGPATASPAGGSSTRRRKGGAAPTEGEDATADTPAWVLEATQGLEPPDWFAAAAVQSASSEPSGDTAGSAASGPEPRDPSSTGAPPWGVPAGADAADPFAAGEARPGRKRANGGRGGGESDDLELTPEEAEAKARAIILRQLSMVARTRQQLAEKLAAGEVPQDTADALLDRFEELGLVDDRAFAMMWVRTRSTTRRLAASALRRELLQRGVDPEYIAEALEQLSDDDQRAAARELVDKKLRVRRPGEPRDKTVRRLVSMLVRKGYGGGMAFGVVNEALAAAGEDGDPDEFDTLDG
ncbi:RecX family transcriptional regulator [Zhihengliuella sp.]|uniref:RecX family transcriptional regulator n=1 Tax=Zhihengliuella sp. TaxID=1954483 RepID=UPI002811B014|nr:RecX family transcriptional regulator [Zhihengliuella sp.]